MGHLRQPWDPRDRAGQEPPVGTRCQVTPVDGMISGYDYDYDYIYIYIYIYIYMSPMTIIDCCSEKNFLTPRSSCSTCCACCLSSCPRHQVRSLCAFRASRALSACRVPLGSRKRQRNSRDPSVHHPKAQSQSHSNVQKQTGGQTSQPSFVPTAEPPVPALRGWQTPLYNKDQYIRQHERRHHCGVCCDAAAGAVWVCGGGV